MKKECSVRQTSIGGQALIEGVMMIGPQQSAMAIRQPDGNIFLDTWDTAKGPKPWYKRTPFVRGIFNFIGSMITGYKCLMRSADLSGMDEEEPSPFEQKLKKLLGDKFFSVLSLFAMVLGVGLSLLLFMVLPTLLVGFFGRFIQHKLLLSLVEGGTKILIFILYLMAVSKTAEMRRIFQYHGAEHKTIACYEAGEELTVENIRRHSRFHPRCGTSFILIVLTVSVLVNSLISWDSLAYRVVLKLLLLPLVVGIAYEIIRLAGRYNNPFTRFISAPGIWLQNFTTNEPEDDQIEVAIASMTPCIPADGSDLL